MQFRGRVGSRESTAPPFMPEIEHNPAVHAEPQGSKDLNNRVLGPKCYTINGIWALKPDYLGPWTLSGNSISPKV